MQHFANPNAQFIAYPANLQAKMNHSVCDESAEFLSTWQHLNGTTPLRHLPNLAKQLGIGGLAIKDESARSDLGSFKALGAPVALVRQILANNPDFTPTEILLGKYKDKLQNYTVISATDGNHGKGLAAAAQSAGCGCVIVLHANVSTDREQAIAQYGAKIVRITGNYDESVDTAKQLAKDNGWQVIADTSYDDYEIIPRDVMQGYGIVAKEVMSACNDSLPFTHIIVQGGVGGLAAGVIAYWWQAVGASRPRFIIAEPAQADCLFQSAKNAKASNATGSVDSVMAGLACGETSPLAWEFLANSVDDFVLVDDDKVATAMQTLATGKFGDVPMVAGESGVAGLVLLQNLTAELKSALKMDEHSKVLLINTEGDTDKSAYERLSGLTAEQVLEKQRQFSLVK